MTGIIFTGHGTFASGMRSVVSLLVGDSDYVLSVDFPGDNMDLLKEKLRNAISILQEKQCQEILILCDILGGSPFNTAATLSQSFPHVRIIYGVNAAIAVELSLKAEDSDLSIEELTSLLADSHDMIGLFSPPAESAHTVADTDQACVNDMADFQDGI